MGTTAKQRRMTDIAEMCKRIMGGERSLGADKINADQRKVEKRKRRQFRRAPR